MDKDTKRYPYCHLTLSEGAPEIPEEGTITLRFVRTRKSEETPRNGEERCEVSLDFTEILAVNAQKAEGKSRSKETEDALDAIASALAKKNEDEED